jgi:hypothetical protein
MKKMPVRLLAITPAAPGNIGAAAVARSRPDGYTRPISASSTLEEDDMRVTLRHIAHTGQVERYEVDGLGVLKLASAVLRVEVEVPAGFISSLRGPRQGDTMHV